MDTQKTELNIVQLADKVIEARKKKDIEAEKAATLDFIDHLLARKATKAVTINSQLGRVFLRPKKIQKYSGGCTACTHAAEARLKKWRDDYLPSAKPPVLIPELWGHSAGETILSPINVEATIQGFTEDKTAAVILQDGQTLHLTKDEFRTYARPEPPQEQGPAEEINTPPEVKETKVKDSKKKTPKEAQAA